jgi:hypothetical protein
MNENTEYGKMDDKNINEKLKKMEDFKSKEKSTTKKVDNHKKKI